MENLKVSLIVPMYNAGEYIKRCIESLYNQIFRNIEMIFIDDGSADNSSFICDSLIKRDSRIKVIHKKNSGVSETRKIGTMAATGEYIMYVDSDDWIDEDTVKSCMDVVDRYPNIGCVLFSYMKECVDSSIQIQVFDESKDYLESSAFKKNIYRRIFGLINEELNHPERLEYLTTCWMKLYRSNLAKSGKFIDINEVGSCEDGIFNIYALSDCESAAYIDYPFYHYRKIKNSLSDGYRPSFINQWSNLFSMMRRYIDNNNLDKSYIEALNNRVGLSIIGIGMNEYCNPNLSFTGFRKYIKNYISSDMYQHVFTTMKLKRLPLPWKVLIWCCKHKLSYVVCLILFAIKKLK